VNLVAHAPEIEGSVRVVGGPVPGRAAEMWLREARSTAIAVQRILAEGWMVGRGRKVGRAPAPPTTSASSCPAGQICATSSASWRPLASSTGWRVAR